MKTTLTPLENLSDDQLEELRKGMFDEMERRENLKRAVPPKEVIARLKKLQKYFDGGTFTVKVESSVITIDRYYNGYSELPYGLTYAVKKFNGPKIFAPILNQDVVASEIKRIVPEIYKEDVSLAKEYKKLSDQYSNWMNYV